MIVKDIYLGTSDSSPENLTNVNGTLYFTADNGPNGDRVVAERRDGGRHRPRQGHLPRQRQLVPDRYLTNVNGTLFFTAITAPTAGSCGVATGRRRAPSSSGTSTPAVGVPLYPRQLTNVNGTLFFTANVGASGSELWRSDGTEAGTVLVKDIYPGSASSSPYQLTNVNGTLFFTADSSCD